MVLGMADGRYPQERNGMFTNGLDFLGLVGMMIWLKMM